MIDIHSHILPGIDDGAKSIEETIEMLKNAVQDGTKKIIATPHYSIGDGKEYEDVKMMVENLNEQIKKENLKTKELDIEIYLGQEIYYNSRLLEYLKDGVIGTLNGSRYILIEFNMKELDEEIFNTLYELKFKGIVPIVAHPERYSYIQKDQSIINKFIEEGCLFQLNAGSIKGMHNTQAKKTAEILINKGIYSFIGSDGHNNKNRKTGIKEAMNIVKEINKKMAEKFKTNGEKLLLNKHISFDGVAIEKKKKGIFSFFKR